MNEHMNYIINNIDGIKCQNDDDYWNGSLKIDQKLEVKEIKYSLDPILIKYQSQIEDYENKNSDAN